MEEPTAPIIINMATPPINPSKGSIIGCIEIPKASTKPPTNLVMYTIT